MLTLSAEVPMFYMCPATFQGSQTASHQVRGSASAMQSYSHCLSPSKNGCNVGKHSQASIWDSPRNQALQVQGFQTHTPGKAEVWAQEMTPPTEDEHHTTQLAAPMTAKQAPRFPCWKCMGPDPLHRFTCSPHLLSVCCLGIRLKTHQAGLFAMCLDNFCHNTVPFPHYSQKMIIQYEDNRDLQQTI